MSEMQKIRDFLAAEKLRRDNRLLDPLTQRALLAKADTPLLTTDFFTTTYGAKVWDALNNDVRFFNLLRKVPWGNRTGWRNRSARTGSSAAISETGNIGDYKKSTFSDINSNPRHVVTPFAVTALAQLFSGMEGGIGDALAIEQEGAKNDHIKFINESIMASGHVVVTTSGASLTAVAKPAGALKPGDTVYGTGAGGADTYTIVSHNATTGVVGFTAAGSGGNWVDGNTMVVKSRLGPTSIDDIVEADGRTFSGANADDVDAYNLTTRTAGTYAAGIVKDNNGVLRDISIDILDSAITAARDAGGAPDVIVTGNGQLDNINALLQAQQRFMADREFRVKVGDEVTLPGTAGGFNLATYKGIPIFADVDAPYSYAETGALGGQKIYVLDTREIEIAVAVMTQYLESSNFIQNDTLSIKALFWSMLELRCRDISKQAKIEDLNA